MSDLMNFTPTKPEAPEGPLDLDTEYQTWRTDPSQPNTARLLKAMDPTISRAARANAGTVNPLLYGRARAMALQAVKSYDPGRGAKLQSHIFNAMQGLKRYSGQVAAGARVPERVVLDRNAMKAAANDLADELGREPTDDELAERTGFSHKRIRHVRRFASPMAEGVFSTMGEDGEPFDPGVMRSNQRVVLQAVYDDLPALDKKVFEWSLGFNGNPVLQNQMIASKLGRSPGWVSQRKLLIQKQINTAMNYSQDGLL